MTVKNQARAFAHSIGPGDGLDPITLYIVSQFPAPAGPGNAYSQVTALYVKSNIHTPPLEELNTQWSGISANVLLKHPGGEYVPTARLDFLSSAVPYRINVLNLIANENPLYLQAGAEIAIQLLTEMSGNQSIDCYGSAVEEQFIEASLPPTAYIPELGLSSGQTYLLDNSSSSLEIQLPENPSIGYSLVFVLLSDANPVIFRTLGNKYIGLNLDIRSSVKFADIELIYSGSSLGWIPTTLSNQNPNGSIHTYSSSGDTNGVFYYYGTNYGSGSWTNPNSAGRLPIFNLSAGDSFVSNPGSAVDRNTGNYAEANRSGEKGTISFDLGSRDLILSGYSFYRNSGSNGIPIDWTFQGSTNGSTWVNLDVKTGQPNSTGWVYHSVNVTTAYRYFRLINDYHPTNGNQILRLWEIELYGTLILR